MFYSLVVILHLLVHPFHVSVTEIKFKKDQKAIQISSRIFLDDLEQALQAYTKKETLDILEPENWDFVNEQLGTYLIENVKVFNEKGQLKANYLGAEIEDDVMYAYIEIEKVKKLKSVTVRNSILTEVFSDQENIIHFRAFEKVKSARLYRGDDEKVFDWVE